jgi:hypothetical protein
MSSVPKGKREKHDLLATHYLTKLRKEITELAVNDFGYDKERLEKKISRFEEWTNCEDKEEVVARMRAKNESFYADFVEEETRETRKILRKAVAEFETGNSIYPSGEALIEEYKERRLHLDKAVGHLFALKQELQYIADILPGDKNRYDGFAEAIKNEISLVRGVRRAANKFLKEDNEKEDTNKEATGKEEKK